jgi:type II secretory pathway pseudopilin PulG
VLIIAVAMIGVLAGGTVTWFQQRRWRRAARRHEADAQAARAQLADLRAASLVQRGTVPTLPTLPALAPGRGYGAGGRDKQGATL